MLLVFLMNSAFSNLSEEKRQTIEALDARRHEYVEISRQVWKWAELSFVEFRSAKLLQDTLRREGFTVEAGLAGIPTAFIASFGQGKPVIGLLAEYDALPGLSQAISTERQELVEGATGHGCGHNLLGTGCVAAGIAIKDWLVKTGKSGTIRVYGCPAEEGGNGKKYMVGDGLFDDVDAAFTWHPANNTGASSIMTIGTYGGLFKFYGIASHASTAPHRGRSALDGVEALNYMVNMMREHIQPGTRIHYIITKGGEATNIVPEYAEVLYTVRDHDLKYLEEVVERIKKAAEGAAMGTGTRVEYTMSLGCVPSILSRTLSELTHRNLRALEPITYNEEEAAFAKELSSRYSPGSESTVSGYSHGGKSPGASDVGFVSHATPTIWINARAWLPGVDAHTWKAVVCNGHSIGEHAMMQAAKAIAITAIDIYNDPSLAEKARQELIKTRGTDEKYRPDISGPPSLDRYKDSVNKQY